MIPCVVLYIIELRHLSDKERIDPFESANQKILLFRFLECFGFSRIESMDRVAVDSSKFYIENPFK